MRGCTPSIAISSTRPAKNETEAGETILGGGCILWRKTKGQEENGKGKLKRKEYEKELRRLQAELCQLQDWVKYKGLRVIVVFEGRDGAGKGRHHSRHHRACEPRVFRVVALPAPSDREKSQMYIQRYIQHFPAPARWSSLTAVGTTAPGSSMSWVFAPRNSTNGFSNSSRLSKSNLDGGIMLIKYWLEVSNKEQERRFQARIEDPLRQWKLSPMDLPSREQWYDYSRARDLMLDATDTEHAPWHIVRSDDKKRARLELHRAFTHVDTLQKVPREQVGLPKRSNKGKYDDQATLKGRRLH